MEGRTLWFFITMKLRNKKTINLTCLLALTMCLTDTAVLAQSINPYPGAPTVGISLYDTLGLPVGDTFHVANTGGCLEARITAPMRGFNGTYRVEQIPYNPADTSFCMNGTGTQLPTTFDDFFSFEDFSSLSAVSIPFDFYFFGIQKIQFRVGDNGIVTFTDNYLSPSTSPAYRCPWSFDHPIPWNASTNPGGSATFNRMHDAVYGVYEDTYGGYNGAYLSGNQGIFYGIAGEAPNRRIEATWNEVPVYGDTSNRQSYQIVCYEGTNIIEVHVRRRGCCSNTNNGRGIIGIQNATGEPQVASTDPTAPNGNPAITGKPAAFWPDGYNNTQAAFDSVSFRFTPEGSSTYLFQCYRIFDDGRDSVALSMNASATNGYYSYVGSDSTRVRLVLPANCFGRYVLKVSAMTLDSSWVTVSDTVMVLQLADYAVTALSSDSTMGTVHGGGVYSEGSVATLMALAHSNHSFMGWDNGADENPYMLLVQGDTTVTAIFSANTTEIEYIHDTTIVNHYATDTLWLHDTVFVHDTIYIHDTIVVGVDEVDAINAKIYTNHGQIVVDGAENNTVWLYDVNGRILATKQDEYSPLHFDVPTIGTYLVKIGNHPARKVVVIR